MSVGPPWIICVPRVVGTRLHKARELRGISQLQLANRLDNSRHMISMVEHGRSGLSLGSLSAAAQALGVSTDFLFGLADDPTPAHDLARAVGQTAIHCAAAERVRDVGLIARTGGQVVRSRFRWSRRVL